ncbi:MAG: ABC transporter ATP-binding protein [Planctomycetes bacterium]|nr:ABC transporter ATP-binding protein [Planctomycetota bacterium]
MIEASGLRKTFEDTIAVDHIDLAVPAGEFFGFLGPNGSGKSTTIGMLTTLLLPDAGTMRVAGLDPVTEPIEVKRRIGVLPEEIQTFERLTVRELVTFAGRIRGMDRSVLDTRREELLELMELSTKERDKLLVDCSMGMRKKAVLCSAIVHKPRVLFLDEPFNGIDARASIAIRGALDALRRGGTTVFFSSHILELVERLCSLVAIVEHGRIRASGTIDDLRSAAGLESSAPFEDVFLAWLEERGSAAQDLEWLSSPSS